MAVLLQRLQILVDRTRAKFRIEGRAALTRRALGLASDDARPSVVYRFKTKAAESIGTASR